ncbi:MAG: sulfatase-like hydrolase/transferase [Alphaproteobacteria bacterium]|jgi:arylsulfatase A-like enzyme|nr:sulfatase-like hydrolase/transferase [Rhodospirillaceae bacterium]MBT6510095.1 sulfatase-like hydrolase/transferase [Rhodospirillaceae bacterium]MDG2482040.1 sulfatase-like hydrolase/transferase [Alphaproteobacteria bacterium]
MASSRPNVVLIFSDNHPAVMMGCSGNADAHTPNLDRLAAGAARFSHAYCPNAMCSPCRASVLTGLMPSQHGLHTWLDDGEVENWPENWNAVLEFDTLPEKLARIGYDTALIGKYHLGLVDAPQNDFREWVTLQRGHFDAFEDNDMIDNGKRLRWPGHMVDFFTEKAVDYVERRGEEPDTPFFLFFTQPAPLGLWPPLKGEPTNRFAEVFRGKPMDSVPREGVSSEVVEWMLVRHDEMPDDHPGYYKDVARQANDVPTIRNYFSQMAMVDDGVGQVLDALERTGAAENTLVIYTSDHGMSLGTHGFWGHGEDSWPSNCHKESHHIPLIVKPPKGSAGDGAQVIDRFAGTTDIFATVLDYAGAEPPSDDAARARSLRPLLEGKAVEWDDAIFMEQEETRAVRTDKWLYMKRFQSERWPFPDALFDLENDPDERNDLATDPEYAAVIAELSERIDGFFAEHSNPDWDLWRGGRVKSNSTRPFLWKHAWGDNWAPLTPTDT